MFPTPRYSPQSRGEALITEILEDLFFPYKFPTVRPDWCRNMATDKCLELDGYNPYLRIAFEYQGPQHYIPHIYNHGDLEYQQFKDFEKRDRCSANGITLFIFPYTQDQITLERMVIDQIFNYYLPQYRYSLYYIDTNAKFSMIRGDFEAKMRYNSRVFW